MTASASPANDPALIPPRWRLPARLLFLTVVALTIVLFAGGLPEYYRQLTTICAAAACPNSPTAATVQLYLSSGISLPAAGRWQVFLVALSAVVQGAVAVLIFWRRPDNRMAWFTALTLLTFGSFGIHGADKISAVLTQFPSVWQLVTSSLIVCGGCAMPLFFFIFPDGRVQPPRLRPLVFGVIVFQVLMLVWPGSWFNPDNWPMIPFLLYWFGFLGLCVYIQIYRYRRISDFAQRQQTKWVVLGLSLATGGALLLFTLLTLAPLLNPAWAVWGLFSESSYYLMLLLLPLSIAVAMLRSRLWDVDVLINRALVYGALTVLLAGIYGGLVIGLQALFTTLTGQTSDLALIGSTLAIVALFQPLRRGVSAFIARRFYRRHYDGQQVLTAFAGVLRDQPYTDPDALSRVLLNLVDDTIQPEHVSLRLVEGARPKPGGGR